MGMAISIKEWVEVKRLGRLLTTDELLIAIIKNLVKKVGYNNYNRQKMIIQIVDQNENLRKQLATAIHHCLVEKLRI